MTKFRQLAATMNAMLDGAAAPTAIGTQMVPVVTLDGAITGATVAPGNVVVADLTDAAAWQPRLRASSPWRGIAHFARVTLDPALTVAELRTILDALSLVFSWNGGRHAVPLRDVYVPTGAGPVEAEPLAPLDGGSYRELPYPIATLGSSGDRVQLVAQHAATIASVGTVRCDLFGAWVDPGSMGTEDIPRIADPTATAPRCRQ